MRSRSEKANVAQAAGECSHAAHTVSDPPIILKKRGICTAAFSCSVPLGIVASASIVVLLQILPVVQELLIESWIFSNSFLVPPAQMMQSYEHLVSLFSWIPTGPESRAFIY